MTSYWISDICVLFNSASINPFSGEDRNFRYNALTRLIILTTIVSAIFFKNFKDHHIFFVRMSFLKRV